MKRILFSEIFKTVALEEYREKEHKPGEKVKISGIYDVTHDTEHKVTGHQVTCVEGDKFPPCRACGEHPRFKLVYEAKHILHDDHLDAS